jgi:putative ABC transport system permease protein
MVVVKQCKLALTTSAIMFRLNLKIALRNLWKYKGYTAINILGLAIGLASCILIFIFVRFELSYDQKFENSDRIYRVVSSWKYADGNQFYSQGVPRPLAAALRNDFSQFEKVAAIQEESGTLKMDAQNGKAAVKVSKRVFYVEPSFFQIFDYQWLSGNPQQSLTAPNTVVLSEQTARTFFGDWKNAVGKRINFDNGIDLKVTGIIKDNPSNSSFPLNILISYSSYTDKNSKSWNSVSSSSECYVSLKPGATVAQLDLQMKQFIKKYYVENSVGKEIHYFQPLSDIHHNENYGNFKNQLTPYKQLIGLSVIGLFLLLTACINFINLATAQAVSRSKEVGVRKVMGSRRKQLIWQFLSETLLITVIALLLACVLVEISLPAMASLFDADTTFSLFGHPIIFVFLLIMILVVSFLAGLYPALVMSRFSPALAIKNKVSAANAGGVGLRKALVVVQFAITAILIVSTLVVMKQMSYIRDKSMGYDTKAIAMIEMPQDSLSLLKFATLAAQLSKVPGIKAMSFNSAAPTASNNNETSFSYNSAKNADFQLNIKLVDDQYFETFGLKLIAGKILAKSDTIKEIVVNETFLKKLNVKNPNEALGKMVTLWGTKVPIVGVIKDFNNFSLHETIAPIALFSRKKNFGNLAIRLEKGELVNTMKTIESTFNGVFPNSVYSASFLADEIEGYYHTEQVMGVLFRVFAGVVIFISFIGLFGMISFVATQRTKEIAIRKVLGASNFELVKMLNSSFMWMVLVANLLAWPIAYVLVNKWLGGFHYRIELSFWPFLTAAAVSMFITLATVSLRSYRAAKANTIDALKYE